MASYREQFAAALQNYGKNPDPVAQRYEQELMRPVEQNDNAHLVRLADSLTGSNLSSGLPKQESMKDRLAQLLQLRQGMEGQRLNGLGKLAGMESDAQDKAMQRAFQEKMYGLNLLKAKAKMAGSSTRKLGAEDIKAINNVDEILGHLPKLKQALDQGHSLNPGLISGMMGDNPATSARRSIVEALGRLQSGGAMSKDEVNNFTALVGQLMDSPETRNAKIGDLFNSMKSRRQNYIQGPSADYQGPSLDSVTTASAAPSRAPTASKTGLAGMDIDNMSDAEIAALYQMHGGQ